MRKLAVKGKEWRYHVGSTKTKLDGPKGTLIILNSQLSKGKDVRPGHIMTYISRNYT